MACGRGGAVIAAGWVVVIGLPLVVCLWAVCWPQDDMTELSSEEPDASDPSRLNAPPNIGG